MDLWSISPSVYLQSKMIKDIGAWALSTPIMLSIDDRITIKQLRIIASIYSEYYSSSCPSWESLGIIFPRLPSTGGRDKSTIPPCPTITSPGDTDLTTAIVSTANWETECPRLHVHCKCWVVHNRRIVAVIC